jgi:ubiquinone/menaquinone biosynthesis C-methylase UbiE
MDVRDANILVHSRMAAAYNEREPHFRPENQAMVRARLERLRREFGGRLLDIGCGTGFIIDLAVDLFDDVRGIDLTPAMLAQVRARPNVQVYTADAARLPFEADCFDVVSAYSFFHHLQDLDPVLAEVHRVLRRGGCLYVDLEPNRHFWLNAMSVRDKVGPSTSSLARDEFGIPAEVFDLAEYNKSITGGIDPDEFTEKAERAGFGGVEVTYEWFGGQGKILHGVSAIAAAHVDDYLRQALPLSRSLYKYLRFLATKP